ncbi:hypothetical protein T484DRAFT_1768790 [Baffinella frigidus]|nr:hypothetical protein T484DRAFT_1768790 [Cryptophyta sp. CCMP2293]
MEDQRPPPDGITVLGHTLDRRKPLASYLVFPCRVTALEVKGNDRTRREVVEREMKAALAATDHHQLAVELAHASFRLEESFKDAVCEVDCADATGGDGADDAVKIAVHEKARHTLSYSTAAKDGEGSLEVAWTVRHLLPYGERLRTAVSMGLNGSNQFRAMFARPHAVEGISLSGEAFTEAHADPSQALPREKRRGVVVRGAQHEGPHSVSLEVCERSWASPGVGERPSLKGYSSTMQSNLRALLEHEFEVAGFPAGAHF